MSLLEIGKELNIQFILLLNLSIKLKNCPPTYSKHHLIIHPLYNRYIFNI